MKPTLFIPPVFALIVATAWLGSQRQAISRVETESAALRKQIASRSTTAEDPSLATALAPAKVAKGKEPLDWKKIAAQFSEMQQGGGMGDMRAMMRLQQRLQEMSKEELVAALEEIAALDLSDESRAMLEQLLIGPLIQKDPESALTRFIGRLEEQNGSMAWTLSNGLEQWAKKDPAKASAWFDAQIAGGKFDSKALDGKSRSRNQFEGALIQVLLGSDPAAAALRLGAMPEDQRSEVLSRHSFEQLKDEEHVAFAELVRGQVPEKDQARTLGQQATRLVGKEEGYEKVTKFMDRIDATPAERTACVEQAATSKIQSMSYQKKVTREDLDAMREWTTAQSPASTDSLTGKALANASQGGGNKMMFEDAAALATQYHETSGNDDVLVSFLEGRPARQNKDQARLLAEKISDEKRRGEILDKLK